MSRTTSRHRTFAAAITILGLLSGCSREHTIVGNDQIVGSGRIVSESRSPGTYDGIQLLGVGKVYVTQDSVESLRIESDDNIIGFVETTVSGGVLTVQLRDGSYSNITLRVYATMKHPGLLSCSGAGEIRTTGAVHIDALVCRLTGAGIISISGTSADQTIEINGAGSILNFDMVSSRCSASISGSGVIETTATESLQAAIAGTGTITYGGNPTVVHTSIAGFGSIRPRN
jgi:hypothetical protein